MAKVFTGKISIPGDKMDEYFEMMKKSEEERAPFRNNLISLNKAFEDYLAHKFSRQTAHKHALTIEMFIEFLCRHTDVQNLQEVTVGIANSHFRTWYKRKVLDSSTESDLKTGVQKFFRFLADEKGIVNQKVLNSFSKSSWKSNNRKAEPGQQTVVISVHPEMAVFQKDPYSFSVLPSQKMT